MWYLTEQDPLQRPAPKYWLGGRTGGGRTIGRKHVDIRLKISSVSRTHAKISVQKAAFYTPTGADVRRRYQTTSVSVQDSSAYGTFLKYPPGHASNRGENLVGHHRRLDKDEPTDVREGALLAFGAPSSWWKVGWHSLVVFPSRLSEKERSRLDEIAALTSLEIAASWPEEVTHFVTNQCVASSVKFLTALVNGKAIVTTAWVETVFHAVSNACRAIAEAPNETSAEISSNLAEERHYAPKFSPADDSQFSSEVLAAVFDSSRKERRATLLSGIAIAFSQDDRRAKWAALIEALGGTAILAKTASSQSLDTRVIYLQPESGSKKKEHDFVAAQPAQSVPLTALIEAILRADISPLEATVRENIDNEVQEVATPGPLEEDSGAESGESEPVGDGDDPHVDDMECVDAPSAVPVRAPKVWKKRARGTTDPPPASDQDEKKQRTDAPEKVPDDEAGDVSKENVVDNSDINPVSYFKVPNLVKDPESFEEDDDDAVDDVRLFRRRDLPTAIRIKQQRVRYVPFEETAGELRASSEVDDNCVSGAGESRSKE